MAAILPGSRPVRTRFAPSPTGYLHLGGARTALFAWLYARKHGGAFILRIEDTDRKRSESRFEKVIFEDLGWLGLDWDEGPDRGGARGPYRQSERQGIYEGELKKLLEEGKAYRCFCAAKQGDKDWTPGAGSLYPKTCLSLPAAESKRRAEAGEPFAVRLNVDRQGPAIRFRDHVGSEGRDMVYERAILDDLVLWKSDGSPTYNFAVAVDDHQMGVSHVIRGDDHLSNTPKQILVYEALGRGQKDWPLFCHVPLILGPDGAPLSKRHGAASVGELRERGYLPHAVMNFLALLGWSYDDKSSVFSREDLISKFSLEGLGEAAARLDYKKLDFFNAKLLRDMPEEDFAAEALRWLPEGGERDWRRKLVLALRGNIEKLSDLPAAAEYFFQEPKAESKPDLDPATLALLSDLAKELEACPSFEAPALEALCRALPAKHGLKFKDLVHPARLALTGRTAGPGFFDLLVLIGRGKAVGRLKAFAPGS